MGYEGHEPSWKTCMDCHWLSLRGITAVNIMIHATPFLLRHVIGSRIECLMPTDNILCFVCTQTWRKIRNLTRFQRELTIIRKWLTFLATLAVVEWLLALVIGDTQVPNSVHDEFACLAWLAKQPCTLYPYTCLAAAFYADTGWHVGWISDSLLLLCSTSAPSDVFRQKWPLIPSWSGMVIAVSNSVSLWGRLSSWHIHTCHMSV